MKKVQSTDSTDSWVVFDENFGTRSPSPSPEVSSPVITEAALKALQKTGISSNKKEFSQENSAVIVKEPGIDAISTINSNSLRTASPSAKETSLGLLACGFFFAAVDEGSSVRKEEGVLTPSSLRAMNSSSVVSFSSEESVQSSGGKLSTSSSSEDIENDKAFSYPRVLPEVKKTSKRPIMDSIARNVRSFATAPSFFSSRGQRTNSFASSELQDIARTNPDALIPKFFENLTKLDSGKSSREKSEIEGSVRLAEQLALEHIKTLPANKIIENLTNPAFCSPTETEAPSYPLKEALLGEFFTRPDRNYSRLREAFTTTGGVFDMVVFKATVPEPSEMQRIAEDVGKHGIKVVAFSSNPTIDRLPKSISHLPKVEHIIFSDCNQLETVRIPKGLLDVKTIKVNGESLSVRKA